MTAQLRSDTLDVLIVGMTSIMREGRAGTIAFACEPDGHWSATIVGAGQE